MSNRIRHALLALIAAVWAVNMTVPIFNKTYEPPTGLNEVFMVVAGAVASGYDRGKKKKPPPTRQETLDNRVREAREALERAEDRAAHPNDDPEDDEE